MGRRTPEERVWRDVGDASIFEADEAVGEGGRGCESDGFDLGIDEDWLVGAAEVFRGDSKGLRRVEVKGCMGAMAV